MNQKSKKRRFKCFLNRFFCVVLAVFLPVHLCSIYTFADDTIDPDNFYISSTVECNYFDYYQSDAYYDLEGTYGYYFTEFQTNILYSFYVTLDCTYIGDDVIDSNCVSLYLRFMPYLSVNNTLVLSISDYSSYTNTSWDNFLTYYSVSCGLDNFSYEQYRTSYNSYSNTYISSSFTSYCTYFLSPRCYATVDFVDSDNAYFTQGSVSFFIYLTAGILNDVNISAFIATYDFNSSVVIRSDGYMSVLAVESVTYTDNGYTEYNELIAYLKAVYFQNDEIISLLETSSDVDTSAIEAYLEFIYIYSVYIDEDLCDILASVDFIDSNLETVISELQSIYSLVDSLLVQIDDLSLLLSDDLDSIYDCLSDIYDMSYVSCTYLNLFYTLLRNFYNNFTDSSDEITHLLSSINSGVSDIYCKLDSLDDIVDLLNDLIDKLDELELDLSIVDDDSVYQETLQEFSDIVNEYADYEGDVNELLLDLSVSLDNFSVSASIDSNISSSSESLNNWFDLFMQIPLLSSLVVCSLTVSVVFVFIRRKGDSV